MKEFKGTKGTWELSSKKASGRVLINLGINEDAVDVWHYDASPSLKRQFEANAKLIASAPDLLEALQEVYNDSEVVRLNIKTRIKLEQAIQKALG